MFAEALRAVQRLPLAVFAAYGLNGVDVAVLVERLLQWAGSIDQR